MAAKITSRHADFAERFNWACGQYPDCPDTQTALGKFLGVSGTMAWNYRNGEKLPGMKTAIRIALRLNVCVEWLLTGRGPRRPDDVASKNGAPPIEAMTDAFLKLLPAQQAALQAVIDSMAQCRK